MKKNFWITLLLVYPLFGVISIPMFHFFAYSEWFYKFSFRNALYRFWGWTVIPFYSISGFFILLAIIIFTIICIIKKLISKKEIIIILSVNIISWFFIAYSYFRMI
jgi:hypothetical protein